MQPFLKQSVKGPSTLYRTPTVMSPPVLGGTLPLPVFGGIVPGIEVLSSLLGSESILAPIHSISPDTVE
jgi:hypothetical protein